MIDPGQSHVGPHAGRFRFSLRALFLFVLVSGLAFSHFIASRRLSDATWRLRLANDENRKLRQKLGELNIEDASRLHVASSPQFLLEDLKWRWQVYVPRSGFRLSAIVNPIPPDGMPSAGAKPQCVQLPQGEFTLDIAIRKNLSGQWELRLEVPIDPLSSQPVTLAIPHSYATCLDAGGGRSGMRLDFGALDPGKPLVLLRYRRPKEFGDLQTGDDPEPCEGVMIWIDEQ